MTGSNTRWLKLWEVETVRGFRPPGKISDTEHRFVLYYQPIEYLISVADVKQRPCVCFCMHINVTCYFIFYLIFFFFFYLFSGTAVVMEQEIILDGTIVSAAFDNAMDMGIVGTTAGTLWYINWAENSSIRLVSGHKAKVPKFKFKMMTFSHVIDPFERFAIKKIRFIEQDSYRKHVTVSIPQETLINSRRGGTG